MLLTRTWHSVNNRPSFYTFNHRGRFIHRFIHDEPVDKSSLEWLEVVRWYTWNASKLFEQLSKLPRFPSMPWRYSFPFLWVWSCYGDGVSQIVFQRLSYEFLCFEMYANFTWGMETNSIVLGMNSIIMSNYQQKLPILCLLLAVDWLLRNDDHSSLRQVVKTTLT